MVSLKKMSLVLMIFTGMVNYSTFARTLRGGICDCENGQTTRADTKAKCMAFCIDHGSKISEWAGPH